MTKIRLLSLVCALAMLFTAVPTTVLAASDNEGAHSTQVSESGQESQETDGTSSEDETTDESVPGYDEYLSANGEVTYPSQETVLSLQENEVGVNADQPLTLNFAVSKAGYYRLSFDYKFTEKGNRNAKYVVSMDGSVPFEEADKLSLSRLWTNETEITTDDLGNDINPPQVEVLEWQNITVYDATGYYSDPLYFYLTEGNHTLSLQLKNGAIQVRNVELASAQKLISYEEYESQNSDVPKYDGDNVLIEGEDALYKSEMYLIAQNDMQSPLTTPYSPSKIKLNAFGGGNWSSAHEKVTWTVDVPETALYRLSFRFKQNAQDGVRSYRRLYINGVTPFAEAEKLSFAYADGWQSLTFDYYILLEAGENTLTLEAVLGDSAEILGQLQDAVLEMNNIYRSILMVTGSVPDAYRDYNLDTQIPDLMDRLNGVIALMNSLSDNVLNNYGESNSLVAQLDTTIAQIQKMADNPRDIAKSLTAFKNNIATIGSYISTFRSQSLTVDCMELVGENGTARRGDANFLESIQHSFRRFIASFTEDYTSLSGSSGEGSTLTVWLPAESVGRDQANVLRRLVTNDFTPNYGINVNVELVQGALIESTLAGKGPDIALTRADTDPVNLAMRNALVDLSEFDDFDSIKELFPDGAFIPFEYEGGTYAVPEKMTFEMMFCRTDILDELGLEPPKTWDEMIKLVYPVVSRNNMEIGIGNLTKVATMNASNIFTNLLYQKGGSVYNEDLTATALDTQVAFEAFSEAASMYRDYLFPTEYSDVNRFRTGEMPILIAPYTQYNQYMYALPELEGLWEMYPIPGVEKEDGTIDISQAVQVNSAFIFKNCDDLDAAWTFLKWWISTDVQANFGLEVEAVLGSAGRYNTANVEALQLLPWEEEQLEPMNTQIASSVFIPQLPGSYFTSRAINSAFVSTVSNGKNASQQILYWSEQINAEITRKREEFGIE